MTSEIRANTLKNRVGLGTVSFTNTGPVISGVTTIASGGKLSIGGVVPTELLHVSDAGNPYILIEDTDADNQVGVKFKTTNYNWIAGLHGGVDTFKISKSTAFGSPPTSDFLSINTVGKVSILNDLDVDGHTELDNVNISGVTTATTIKSTSQLKLIAAAGNSVRIRTPNDDDNVAVFNIDDSTHLYYNSAHKFSTVSDGIRSIGNVTLAEKIIHDGDSDTYLQFTANTINLHSGGTTGLSVLDASVRVPTKLGINGAAPQTPLDVIADGSGYAMAIRGRSSDNTADVRFTSNNYGTIYGQILTGPTYLKISTGGQERLELDVNETTFNNPGADTDFRIRTPAQTHMFYVNAGTNQVSIKTSNAASGAELTVNGRTHTDTQFTIGSNSTLDGSVQATIYKPATNTLAFATAGANERLRINASGNVKLPDSAQLQFGGALSSGDGDLQIYHDSGGNSFIKETGSGSLVINANDFYLQNVATTTLLRTHSSGQLDLNHNGNTRAYTGSDGFYISRVNTFSNPNNTGSETQGAMIDLGGNIHFKEIHPTGAYTDRCDLVLNTNSGYGLGLSDKLRITAGGQVIVGGNVGHNESSALLSVHTDASAGANMLSDSSAIYNHNNPAFLHIANRYNTGTGQEAGIILHSKNSHNGSWAIYSKRSTSSYLADLNFRCRTGSSSSAQRFRMTSAGMMGFNTNPNRYLHVQGRTDGGNFGTAAFEQNNTGNGATVMFMSTLRDGSSGESFLQCNRDQNNDGQGVAAVFYIRTNGDVDSATNSYGGISDIKLKENIVDASPQWDDIKNLKVRKFNFKSTPDEKMLGVVAQEVELTSPGLVKESPDENLTSSSSGDEGTTTKSVKYSILYMKAIKCLQEAQARIETLEAKVSALEGS